MKDFEIFEKRFRTLWEKSGEKRFVDDALISLERRIIEFRRSMVPLEKIRKVETLEQLNTLKKYYGLV